MYTSIPLYACTHTCCIPLWTSTSSLKSSTGFSLQIRLVLTTESRLITSQTVVICHGMEAKAWHCSASSWTPWQLRVQLKSLSTLAKKVAVAERRGELMVMLAKIRLSFWQASLCSTHPPGRDWLARRLERFFKSVIRGRDITSIGVCTKCSGMDSEDMAIALKRIGTGKDS